LRQFRALADGHAEADRLREARLVAAVRVAVNGNGDQVAAFLGGDRPGSADGFDTVDDILKRHGA